MPDNPSARCPVCGKPAEGRFSPFCSRRCADVDLGRWLIGTYRVPGPPAEHDDNPPLSRSDPA